MILGFVTVVFISKGAIAIEKFGLNLRRRL
jgi:hypothetical protein